MIRILAQTDSNLFHISHVAQVQGHSLAVLTQNPAQKWQEPQSSGLWLALGFWMGEQNIKILFQGGRKCQYFFYINL